MSDTVIKLKKELEKCRNSEADLMETVKKYQGILDEIEDVYLETDLNGCSIFYNKSFCRVFGYPLNSQRVINVKNHVDKDVRKRFWRKTGKGRFRDGVPIKGFIHEITRTDGNKRTLENYATGIFDTKGTLIGIRSVLRDITDRIRTREELMRNRSRLEAIFRSITDAIITVDGDMTVIEANKEAENICGQPLKTIIGKRFKDCFIHCQGSCYDHVVRVLKEKKASKGIRVACNREDFNAQVVDISVSPLLDQDEKAVGAVLLIKDVTRLIDLEKELDQRHHFHNMIGGSMKMQQIYKLLEDLSDFDTTVLVTGESGTGKELIASALHYNGVRRDKPLIKVNCSALAENLLESELFGHVKGAFTGAVKDKRGRFKAADGGSILLDEIGDVSPRIQLKLLRVLQEKEFERVGESTPIKVDVRVISCTNQDMKKKVMTGEFREDLYYRLKVMEITLPPLRERMEDLPLLVKHFCDKHNKAYEKYIEGVSSEVLSMFMNYPWPGNIRELEHAIEHAFVLCRTRTIGFDHIPADIRDYTGGKISLHSLITPTHTAQKTLEALNRTGWNKAKAARLLGVDRTTVYRWIDKYNLGQ